MEWFCSMAFYKYRALSFRGCAVSLKMHYLCAYHSSQFSVLLRGLREFGFDLCERTVLLTVAVFFFGSR